MNLQSLICAARRSGKFYPGLMIGPIMPIQLPPKVVLTKAQRRENWMAANVAKQEAHPLLADLPQLDESSRYVFLAPSRDPLAATYAIVDAEDFDRVAPLTWRAYMKCGITRAITHFEGISCFQLSRFVKGTRDPSIQVRYINGNSVDCRKSNLREGTGIEHRKWRKDAEDSMGQTNFTYLRRNSVMTDSQT